jgi:hypothetical protein
VQRARVLAAALAAVLVTGGCAAVITIARDADAYALDDAERARPERGKKPACDAGVMKIYRGTSIRYATPIVVHPAFVERLRRFEEVAREVGVEVYGRAPKTLVHAGGFACRPTQSGRLSEHALGNAIDLDGFVLPALSKRDLRALGDAGVTIEPKLRGALRVRVSDAWREKAPAHARRFYALLLRRLRARGDVFRGIIGPPTRGHASHLHLDAGRWAYDWYDPPA